MIKETITYDDYNGNKRTEDFYFNLTRAEAMKLELGKTGGLTATIRRIISAQDGPEIIKLFEELLLTSYGVKSLDGKRFEKSEEISRAFSQTPAYSILFMKLATDADYAAKFVNGLGDMDTNVDIETVVKEANIPGLENIVNMSKSE